MWTFQRYQTWLENKKAWHFPGPEPADREENEERAAPVEPLPAAKSVSTATKPKPAAPNLKIVSDPGNKAIEIEPVEGGLDEVLKKLKP